MGKGQMAGSNGRRGIDSAAKACTSTARGTTRARSMRTTLQKRNGTLVGTSEWAADVVLWLEIDMEDFGVMHY